MAILDIEREQQEAMPREDLSSYAGQWVALRDGVVVASDIDAVSLRANPGVRKSDTLIPVPLGGPGVFML
jgi:hypothetical protein